MAKTSRFAALAMVQLALAPATGTAAHAKDATPRLTAEDRLEIYDLYSRFAFAVDQGWPEKLADTMTEDGEFYGGRPASVANLPRVPEKGREGFLKMGNNTGNGTRHFYSNITLAPKPDGTVEGHAYMILFMARPLPITIGETAVYDDTIVKTKQGWKFKKRIVWRDDDPKTPYKFKDRPMQGIPGMPPGTAPVPIEQEASGQSRN